MKILLGALVLMFGGVVYNLVMWDIPNVIAGFVIFSILLSIYVFFKRQEFKSKEFISWIHYNRDQILREGAMYEHATIDRFTEITQFQICFSFMIFSAKLSTRHYIKDYHNTTIISLLCTFITLITGWWGLPWGPIFTIQTVAKNILGGSKRTVADYLAAVDEYDENVRNQYHVGHN